MADDKTKADRDSDKTVFVFVKNIFSIHGVLTGLLNYKQLIFALHKVLKTSACVTKNPKKTGDSSLYAGDREKGLKISRLPPNAGDLTVM